MMGGEIGVNSTYGEGSEFYFTIRQKIAEDIPVAELADRKEKETYDPLNFKAPDAKILLVDDNKMNLKVAMGLLAPLQMQIDTAENGKQAMEKIKTCIYDLVFMDHMMPIMDGVEATRRIRETENMTGAHLTIIALTADAMSGAKEEFMAAGMDDFVAKPIEIKEICGKLRKYLPQEKIVKTEECLIVAEETDDLPQIEGLDVEAGVHYSGSRALFINLLGDYYKLIDTKIKKIRQCLSDGMIRDLTIEVHALKNTSRMIGAIELSERFEELEALGNANDGKALEEKVPEVLELYAGYKSVLSPYGAVDEASLQETSKDELCRILTQMADAMDSFDLDGVDAAMAELEQYRMPEELSDDMDTLRAAVADVAMEEVITKSHAMIEYLQNKGE